MSSTIFLIDDDQTFREVMARSLNRLSQPAVDFAHPQQALTAIQQAQAPIVLLDLKLEQDSGLRWIAQIKAHNQQARILLLTGYASISTAVEAIKLGAEDYLVKPITARQLLEYLFQDRESENTPIVEKPMSVERLEWEHIQKILTENQGNISATARALGMHRRTLQRKLAKRPRQE